jgi:hypothetical protein
MHVKFFRRGYGNAWELNLIGKVWSLRIGGRQVALWRNYEPVFDVH